MNQAKTFEQHALRLGKLVGNLQTLEMAARLALVKLDARQSVTTQLPQVREGERVELNAFTNKNDLRQTLQKYNKHAPPSCRVDVDRAVVLRDALAHGRTFGFGPLGERPIRLLKFDRKKDERNKIKVTMAVDMTGAWFTDNIEFLQRELEKVRIALDYEKRELSGSE